MGATAVLVLAVTAAATTLALTGGTTPPAPIPTSPSSHHPPSKAPALPAKAAPSELTPSAAGASQATYVPTLARYRVVVSASGPCWIEARATAGSPVTWTATLAAGGSHSLSADGPLWIRVGNAANVSLSLDGAAVRFPSPGASPYDFVFSPAQAATPAGA